MNYSRDQLIGTQAIEALRLWRARDRGDLTQQEYLNALAATQGTVAPQISQTQPECENMSAQDSQRESTESLPKLMSALEVLQLRRSLDTGKIRTQKYLAQVHGHAEPEQPNTSFLDPLKAPTAVSRAEPGTDHRCTTDTRAVLDYEVPALHAQPPGL